MDKDLWVKPKRGRLPRRYEFVVTPLHVKLKRWGVGILGVACLAAIYWWSL